MRQRGSRWGLSAPMNIRTPLRWRTKSKSTQYITRFNHGNSWFRTPMLSSRFGGRFSCVYKSNPPPHIGLLCQNLISILLPYSTCKPTGPESRSDYDGLSNPLQLTPIRINCRRNIWYRIVARGVHWFWSVSSSCQVFVYHQSKHRS